MSLAQSANHIDQPLVDVLDRRWIAIVIDVDIH